MRVAWHAVGACFILLAALGTPLSSAMGAGNVTPPGADAIVARVASDAVGFARAPVAEATDTAMGTAGAPAAAEALQPPRADAPTRGDVVARWNEMSRTIADDAPHLTSAESTRNPFARALDSPAWAAATPVFDETQRSAWHAGCAGHGTMVGVGEADTLAGHPFTPYGKPVGSFACDAIHHGPAAGPPGAPSVARVAGSAEPAWLTRAPASPGWAHAPRQPADELSAGTADPVVASTGSTLVASDGSGSILPPAATLPILAALLLFALPLWLLHRRLARARILDSRPRALVYEDVRAHAGATLTSIAKRTGLDRSCVRHQLRVLEEFGLLKCVRVGQRLAVFQSGAKASAGDLACVQALATERARTIAEFLAREPDASSFVVARRLGVAPSTIRYHRLRLARLGVLVTPGDSVAPPAAASSQAGVPPPARA